MSKSGFNLDYASIDHSRWKSLPNPPGFVDTSSKKKGGSAVAAPSSSSIAVSSSYSKLKQKRAWDLAISPAKSLPMNAFMLYMSGGGVQIFSIGILAMLLLNPFKAVAGINSAFAQFESTPAESKVSRVSLILPKIVFILCNLLTLALGLWKCRSMGLLPTGTGDWLAFETRGEPPEITLF